MPRFILHDDGHIDSILDTKDDLRVLILAASGFGTSTHTRYIGKAVVEFLNAHADSIPSSFGEDCCSSKWLKDLTFGKPVAS